MRIEWSKEDVKGGLKVTPNKGINVFTLIFSPEDNKYFLANEGGVLYFPNTQEKMAEI